MECISGINATKYGPHGYETLLSIVACTLMGRMRAFFATLVGGALESLHPIPKRAIYAPAFRASNDRHSRAAAVKGMVCQSRGKTMREPRLQQDGEIEVAVTSALTLAPLVMANKPGAPVAVLSPTKRTAVIECFNNNGLHKRNGCWCGAPEGKHISGVTVADLGVNATRNRPRSRPETRSHRAARVVM